MSNLEFNSKSHIEYKTSFLDWRKAFQWLFSIQLEEKEENDPAKKLLNSMRLTAKCRFNASVRLIRISKYSFLTTTILSLGLIFIPLYQYSSPSQILCNCHLD